jgi:hypothetical protein
MGEGPLGPGGRTGRCGPHGWIPGHKGAGERQYRAVPGPALNVPSPSDRLPPTLINDLVVARCAVPRTAD